MEVPVKTSSPDAKTASIRLVGDRWKFTGRELDSETGLQFNRARYLDQKTGRWTSQDPLGFEGGDQNLYRYVRNFAESVTDPSGQIELVGKPHLRKKEKIADLDAEVADGVTPYKDITKALIDKLNDDLAKMKTPEFNSLKMPAQLGPIRAGSKKQKIGDDVIAEGTSIWESYLFFIDWDIKCMNLDEGNKLVIHLHEKKEDSRVKPPKPEETDDDRPADNSKAGENAVVKLKNGQYRVIHGDAPGTIAQVKPLFGMKPNDFTFKIDGTTKLVDVDKSEISWKFSFVSKDGKVTTSLD